MPELPTNHTIVANGEFFASPAYCDWHRLVVGTKQHQDFGGGTLTVSQDGHALTDFDAITAGVGKAALLGQSKLFFTLTGATTTPDLEVVVERIERRH